MLPDTHAHLDAAAFDDDRDDVVERAQAAGVDRILAVGSDLASSLRAVELARRYPMVYAAVGIHPHEAGRFGQESGAVKRLLHEEKVVAVGEIGLDYHRELAPRSVQLHALQTQLDWAMERSLPVSVHNRDADEDVMRILRGMGERIVLHCFSGSEELASAAVDEGMYVSFAGNLTFPKAASLREAAAVVPMDRLLVETDSPVLAPQPWRGRRNEPAHVVAVAQQLAEIKGVPLAQLSQAIHATAATLFSWAAA